MIFKTPLHPDNANMFHDSYENFYRLFLQEMPMSVDGKNGFSYLLEILQENLQHNTVIPISNNVFKLQMHNQLTYWHGNDDATIVNIMVDTKIIEHYCKIEYAAKNPNIKGSPYTSDLYLTIVNDIGRLVLTSGSVLSSDGQKLLQGLVNRGNHVAVYDTKQKEYVLNKVENEAELLNYLGDDEKQRYVFVLSETVAGFCNARHSVAIMEIKRKSNWPLDEVFKQCKRKCK